MSPGVAVVVEGGEEIIAALRNLPPLIQRRVASTIQGLGLELANRVKATKLSGQVLNVRTGRLRASIVSHFIEQGPVAFAVVGTNVIYGGYWERGFHGMQQVRQHTRRVVGRDLLHGRERIASGLGFVRAHTRVVNVAARPFLAPSLAEMQTEARQKIAAALHG